MVYGQHGIKTEDKDTSLDIIDWERFMYQKSSA